MRLYHYEIPIKPGRRKYVDLKVCGFLPLLHKLGVIKYFSAHTKMMCETVEYWDVKIGLKDE